MEKIKQKIKEGGSSSGYYTAAKLMGTKEAPIKWRIQQMFPDLSDKEIAEMAADFFNRTSQQFEEVQQADLSKQFLPQRCTRSLLP